MLSNEVVLAFKTSYKLRGVYYL